MTHVWRWVRIIAGFALVGLGVIGLFLPVLQGILFIMAGLLLLAREFHWARRLLDWVRRKREQPETASTTRPKHDGGAESRRGPY